ncbi:hypothetical protein [Streptomyces galilaeus]|uniref:hypothetical protein n=1 Tax=Streptomyces galilaeus TaxID=33899 RepID=UPI0038F6EDC7
MNAAGWITVMAVLAIPVAVQCRLLARAARHHLPAALDNTPGTDPHLLWECRRIDRQTPRKETRP